MVPMMKWRFCCGIWGAAPGSEVLPRAKGLAIADRLQPKLLLKLFQIGAEVIAHGLGVDAVDLAGGEKGAGAKKGSD